MNVEYMLSETLCTSGLGHYNNTSQFSKIDGDIQGNKPVQNKKLNSCFAFIEKKARGSVLF